MHKEAVTVDAGTSVVEAAKLMKACDVESVLVARQAKIIGIVTESDVVKKFVGAEKASYFVPVEEIMSSAVPGIIELRSLTGAAISWTGLIRSAWARLKAMRASAWCRFWTFSDRSAGLN
ncbi:MAG TPA: CBS domain-containing protein [Nitrospira sp.]|nr:CBS domain-containing protein [Nitrospira sp.]